ncbi:MAG: hypothetical protein IKE91_04860 [Clostridia bacterium]|nr:hypothetical protein [Clostridia bacterium]
MTDNDITLLINSCDAYEDILDVFFELLHRFWPDLKYDIVLSTESLEYVNKYFSIKNVHPKDKKCSWSKRMYEALNTIESKQVLLLLDDFFIYDYVNGEEIKRCSEYLSKNEEVVNFTYWPILNGTEDAEIDGYFVRTENERYKITAISALWDRKQFMKYLENHEEDIWEFEVNGTIRSNTTYPNDKFLVLNHENNIIPYNFSKYGLISGKWFKDTVELFKKLGIEFDFEKRGIFNEALYGLNRSFISSFRIEPHIIPNYSTKSYNPVIYYNKVFQAGKFEFKFDLENAKDMVRVTLTEQRGFSVKNLKIEVSYSDGEKQDIDNDEIFGNYTIIDQDFIFNVGSSYICVPLCKNKKTTGILLKGESICPVDEKKLIEAYAKKTESNSQELIVLDRLFDFDKDADYLDIKNIELNPKLEKKDFIKRKKFINFYKYEFDINDRKEHIEQLILSNKCYYSIKGLKVTNDKGEVCRVDCVQPQCQNEYLCVISGTFGINIPENTKKIYVEFKLTNPIKKQLLAKSANLL